MSKTKQIKRRKLLGAKVLMGIVLMGMMLMAEGVINGSGGMPALSFFQDAQVDVSQVTKALHQVVRLLTYSIPG